MRILLDTHIFLWCVKADRHLTRKAKSRIFEASEVYVSSASIWEAIIKIKLGKLDGNPDALVESIAESGFLALPVTVQHTLATSRLPDYHRDPFDRLLIAQAITEPLILLTADSQLKSYSELVELIES